MEELLMKFLVNPEELKETIVKYIDKYKLPLYDALNELLQIYEDYANNKRLWNIEATLKMNYFTALKEAGFTDEQAMALLLKKEADDTKFVNKIVNVKGKK